MLGGESMTHICDECVLACGRILSDPSIPFPGYAEDDDEQLLARLPGAHQLLEASALGLQGLVDVLRQRKVTWARIGEALGISRQAAWERFG